MARKTYHQYGGTHHIKMRLVILLLVSVALIIPCATASSESLQLESKGIFDGQQYYMDDSYGSFSIPILFSDEDSKNHFQKWHVNLFFRPKDANGNEILVNEEAVYVDDIEFAAREEISERLLHSWTMFEIPDTATIIDDKMVKHNGDSVRLVIWEEGAEYNGMIGYMRNNEIIALYYTQYIWSDEVIERITTDDLRAVADLIIYDESKAPYTSNDGEFVLKTKNDQKVVSANGKIQFAIEYVNSKKANAFIQKVKSIPNVNLWFKDGLFKWNVTDIETGKLASDITVDKNGNLVISNTVETTLSLEIKAESLIFHTSAVYPLTIIPAVSKVLAVPSALSFYTGTESTQTITINLEPENVPKIGLKWNVQRNGIVEIIEVEDGVVLVKPVGTGKTTITITEPGGKSTKVNVNVLEPVSTLELTAKGVLKPGGTVTISAILQPKNAGNKELEWFLDVSEDIATIDAKGRIKVSREATPGKIITVTCKALGAPEPIERTIQMEIVE